MPKGAEHLFTHIQRMSENMENKKQYLVPDYFFDFHCKMGACRNACCEGWPISVSLKDYFRLLSVDVSKETRIRLDCSLHMAPNPSPEAYAQIVPRYDGRCPMRMEDGRCALHYELDEFALPNVCRLYPRGVREKECSMANSCEAVIELFVNREEKIVFQNAEMDFHFNELPERKHHFETAGIEEEIRMHLISVIQDRKYPLPVRIARLGMTLKMLSEALEKKDYESVRRIAENKAEIPNPEQINPGHDDLLRGLEMAGELLSMLDERSDSIRDYGECALSAFGSGEHEFQVYQKNKLLFENAFPAWETWFEHMLVNHMFFSVFPFQDRPVELGEEYLALLSVFALLRFLMIGNAEDENIKVKCIDIAAAVFRLVEHTGFDCYAGPMLKRICGDNYENARRLICL